MWNPRMGGEKLGKISAPNIGQGSPPRGRGKAFSVLRRQFRFRITPAWAGKSAGERQRPPRPQDHPRVGREKAMQYSHSRIGVGAPPRGRGKVACANQTIQPDGITPAWAGKRGRCCPDRLRCWDHPRVGGEKSSIRVMVLLALGSPPRGRGKDWWSSPVCPGLGITPAWAGKSACNSSSNGVPWDHPRMGGEKAKIQLRTAKRRGSPPHGRGKDVRQVGAVCGRGITPAQAGKR